MRLRLRREDRLVAATVGRSDGNRTKTVTRGGSRPAATAAWGTTALLDRRPVAVPWAVVYDRAVSDLVITPDDVARAAAAIRGRVHRTPTFSSKSLGPGQHLKAELFQRTGSFKARGALNRVLGLSADERRRGVISASAGNHAQALAWAAASEDVDALLVMWQGASTAKMAATRGYGAVIDLEATDPGVAFARLYALQEQTGRVLVHPFNDPVVIAGAGTVGLEILEDVPAVDTIVVACGGGGLVTGIAAACVPAGVRVIAVEPEHSNALALGLAAAVPVTLTPETVADALTAPFAGTVAIDVCGQLGVEVVLVSDDEIRTAFRFLYERAKLATEPGAAVAVAAVLAGKIEGECVVSVVSGGNVSADIASAILKGP